VGFGNVAAETDNEKVFTICMMIIAGAVFKHVPLPRPSFPQYIKDLKEQHAQCF